MMRVDLPVNQNGLLIERETNHLVMKKMLKKKVNKIKVSPNSEVEMLVVDVEVQEVVLVEQEMLERLKSVMVIGIVLHVETITLQEEQNAISAEKPEEMVVVDSVEAVDVVAHEAEHVELAMQAHLKNVKEIGIAQDVETTILHSEQSVINVEQLAAMEEVVVVGAVEEEVVVEDPSVTVEEEAEEDSEIVGVVVAAEVVVIEVVEDVVDSENEKVSVALKIRERARKLNSTNR